MSPTTTRIRSNDPGPVGYAVVGLGWMAQEAVLPAFANVPDARPTALVSGDADKRRALGRRYGVEALHDYEGYDACLEREDVDAVYLALPNHLHRDYAVRACRAGVHVLCEKPMATTEEECVAMIRAAEESDVRLMVAYRLHFDPANLRALELAESGTLGDIRYFSSVFNAPVRKESDIRLRAEAGGGPLFDIGVYCINAARQLFRAEPEEVWCRPRPAAGNGRFSEVPPTVAAVLGFSGGRVASFVCSLEAAPVDAYRVLGTLGDLTVDPAYDLNADYALRLRVGDQRREESFPASDQVGPQLAYFSRCVLQGRAPEPDGREGLADVRVVRALQRSMETGDILPLEPFDPGPRPTPAQASERPLRPSPELVRTTAPGEA